MKRHLFVFALLLTATQAFAKGPTTIECKSESWYLKISQGARKAKVESFSSYFGGREVGMPGRSRSETDYDSAKAEARAGKDKTVYALSAHARNRDPLHWEQYTDIKLRGELTLDLEHPEKSTLHVVESSCLGLEHHAFTCANPFKGREDISRSDDLPCTISN